MSLRVLRLAAGSCFQDRGRPGWRRFGVPPGGAIDSESYELALAMVGRSDGAALEIPMLGGSFEALDEDILSAVGADCTLLLDGKEVGAQSGFPVALGSLLEIGPAVRGARIYLAGARGWRVAPLLGSVSGVEPEGELSSQNAGPIFISAQRRLAEPPGSLRDHAIRFVRGPHAREEDIVELGAGPFRVGLQSNRVGLRLEGGNFVAAKELPSEASCTGVIQLTPSGELLIHGPDGPTVGGYPKIGVVIRADDARLGQLRPMDEVKFEEVSLDEAAAMFAVEEGVRQRRVQEIRIQRP